MIKMRKVCLFIFKKSVEKFFNIYIKGSFFLISLFLMNFSFAKDSRDEKEKLHLAIIESHDKGNHHTLYWT